VVCTITPSPCGHLRKRALQESIRELLRCGNGILQFPASFPFSHSQWSKTAVHPETAPGVTFYDILHGGGRHPITWDLTLGLSTNVARGRGACHNGNRLHLMVDVELVGKGGGHSQCDCDQQHGEQVGLAPFALINHSRTVKISIFVMLIVESLQLYYSHMILSLKKVG